MNPSAVQLFLGRVGRRQRLVSLARLGRSYLLIALGGCAVIVLVSRLLGLFPVWFAPLTLAVFPAAALILAIFFNRRTGASDAARLADARMGTHDLFLTASVIGGSLGGYQDLVLKQAGERAAAAEPQKIVPFHWRQDALRMGAAAVLLAAGVFLLPHFDPFQFQQKQKQLSAQQGHVQELAKATAARAALIEQNHAGQQTEMVKEAVASLENVFKTAKPNDQAGNQARLNEQQKSLGQLWKQASEEKLKNGLNLPPPTQSFGLADPAKAQQLQKDLQKGDVSSAKKELEDLKQMAQQLAATKDPVAREKLRQEIMDRLQSLKDSLDQQVNSQAMDNDLQRAMEQLAMANTPELASEALKGLSDSMQLSQKELDQLAKAMSDMKNLEDALKALQAAKALNAMKGLDGSDFVKLGDLESYCAYCQGECESQRPGNGLGPGHGYGPRPHGDDSAASGFHPEKAPSPLQPGKMLMEWKTKEVSESGPAREEYLRAVQDVRQQASEAVVEEQIPPGYQDAIKKYFDTLHNDTAASTQP